LFSVVCFWLMVPIFVVSSSLQINSLVFFSYKYLICFNPQSCLCNLFMQ
jgi:hypothetical protein